MLIDTDQIPVRRIDPDCGISSRETALVIIDMMTRFCDAEWLAGGNADRTRFYQEEFARIIPATQQILSAFRSLDALIVHVVNARWTKDGRDVVPYQRGRDYDLFDTPAMAVIEALEPREGEVLIRKVASSAFTGTGLEFILRNAGIRNLALCGQYGDACCLYSLIQSRELGFDNYWIDDAMLRRGPADLAIVLGNYGPCP